MFETDRLPADWPARLNLLDEVWVPTIFNKKIFVAQGVIESKIFVVPESVDVHFYTPAAVVDHRVSGGGGDGEKENSREEKEQKGKNQKNQKNKQSAAVASNYPLPRVPNRDEKKKLFAFLSIFKWEERKGWRFLFEAYLREFSAVDPVVLYILTSNYHSSTHKQERELQAWITSLFPANQEAKHLPPFIFLPPGIKQEDMPSLYRAVDCFVLPSRGEGWGRPHVEAMAMALPVIATLWSGPSQYMTPSNSYPLAHDGLEEIEEGAFKGHKWAKPSVVHLRALMRRVVEHPVEAKAIGEQARRDMVEKYSPEHLTGVLLQHFARITNKYLKK